jgi:hypothetical protein
MKLTRKHPLQAKACSLAAVTLALVTLTASNAAADHVRVFNEKVNGVPAANPVVVSDNVFSPEFTDALVAQGIDLLENPSGLITQFGYLSDGTNTEPDENTYLILDHNPGAPRLTTIMAVISCFRDMRTAATSLTSRASTWM